MSVLQANSLKHLFADDAFCMRVARHFYPDHFNIDESIKQTSFGPVLLKNHLQDELVRGEIRRGNCYDAEFMVHNHFEKSYLLNADNTIKKEFNLSEYQRKLFTERFYIVARKKIATTQRLFINTLQHYRANTLLVEEITIDDLSLEEIRKVAREKKYRVVVMEEIGG